MSKDYYAPEDKERMDAFARGFRQGKFEMMIELIHGSYDMEDELMEIRKEIIKNWSDKLK